MNSECVRIADQLRRAFAGDAWHGPPLRDLLAGVTAEQALSRPVPSAHSIWELVLHISLYVQIALESAQGVCMPRLFGTEKDWPAAENGGAAWDRAQDQLFERMEQLALAIERAGDPALQEPVPGRTYDFYYLFHGIVQHSLYHAGQIALLKKALTEVHAARRA
jgi:hypothetical protein